MTRKKNNQNQFIGPIPSGSALWGTSGPVNLMFVNPGTYNINCHFTFPIASPGQPMTGMNPPSTFPAIGGATPATANSSTPVKTEKKNGGQPGSDHHPTQ